MLTVRATGGAFAREISAITLGSRSRPESMHPGYDRCTMKPSDFWLAAIAVILMLILIRLSALAKHIRTNFPARNDRSTAHLESASK